MRKLEQIGALQLLLRLAEVDQEQYVTRFIRRGDTDDGIASDRALLKARSNLKELGLLIEEVQETLPFRTVMTLTERGYYVAERVIEISKSLKQN